VHHVGVTPEKRDDLPGLKIVDPDQAIIRASRQPPSYREVMLIRRQRRRKDFALVTVANLPEYGPYRFARRDVPDSHYLVVSSRDHGFPSRVKARNVTLAWCPPLSITKRGSSARSAPVIAASIAIAVAQAFLNR
jgi:hypothetical protein